MRENGRSCEDDNEISTHIEKTEEKVVPIHHAILRSACWVFAASVTFFNSLFS